MLVAAVTTLFRQLLKSNDEQAKDGKELSQTSTAELSKTVDILRTVSDAVERHGRYAVSAISVVGADAQTVTDSLEALDRRLKRLEYHGGRRRLEWTLRALRIIAAVVAAM